MWSSREDISHVILEAEVEELREWGWVGVKKVDFSFGVIVSSEQR